jgi:hypothetical protein
MLFLVAVRRRQRHESKFPFLGKWADVICGEYESVELAFVRTSRTDAYWMKENRMVYSSRSYDPTSCDMYRLCLSMDDQLRIEARCHALSEHSPLVKISMAYLPTLIRERVANGGVTGVDECKELLGIGCTMLTPADVVLWCMLNKGATISPPPVSSVA